MIRLIFLILLIPSVVFGGSLQQQHMAILSQYNAAGGAPTLTASDSCKSTTNDYSYAAGSEAARTFVAVSFTKTTTETVGRVDLNLLAIGSPTMNFRVNIHSDATGPSTILDTSDWVDASTVGGSLSYIAFTGLNYELTNAETYWISIEASAVDASNHVELNASTACSPTVVQRSETGSSSWANVTTSRGGNYELYVY